MVVAIVSLKFSPGHIAHLIAYYKMFKELGCKVKLIVNTQYKDFFDENNDIIYVNSNQDIFKEISPDIVFSYNISQYNIKLALKCKFKKIPFYYVLHEPYPGIKEIIKGKRVFLSLIVSVVNAIICSLSSKVLLASKNGVVHYEKRMKWLNKNYCLFPLIFDDSYINSNEKRKYFLFAGAFTYYHGCEDFLKFVKYSIDNNFGIKFMIATKNSLSDILKDKIYKDAIENGTIIVHEGRPMSTQEINTYYRQSICVWNIYKRTVQSGVLPNSLMQGTPVIVNENGVGTELKIDNIAGIQVRGELNEEKILHAYNEISNNIDIMSENARRMFIDKYYYKTYKELARKTFDLYNNSSER